MIGGNKDLTARRFNRTSAPSHQIATGQWPMRSPRLLHAVRDVPALGFVDPIRVRKIDQSGDAKHFTPIHIQAENSGGDRSTAKSADSAVSGGSFTVAFTTNL